MRCRLRDSARAKYELLHSVRTHLGCEDDAFGCMGNGEDAEGIRGVFLRRNVIAVAGRALTANLTRLGPLVLPINELVRARAPTPHPACAVCAQACLPMPAAASLGWPGALRRPAPCSCTCWCCCSARPFACQTGDCYAHRWAPQLPTGAATPAQVKALTLKGYSPNFSRAFEHFLLHTGGRGVIDELEEKLHLTAKQVQPSKDTLYRFGNTSAASTWCDAQPCKAEPCCHQVVAFTRYGLRHMLNTGCTACAKVMRQRFQPLFLFGCLEVGE